MEDSFLPKFVKDLKDKVESKERRHLSEESFLVKSLKFYDAFNVGTVNYSQFQQGLEKLGIYYPKDKMAQLCKLFDQNNRGSIDYTEFAKQIYKPSVEKPKVSLVSETIAEEIKEDPTSLFNYLKERLFHRGACTTSGLSRMCNIIDKEDKGAITLEEFISYIKDLRIDLTNEQVILLFTLFNRDKDGNVLYVDFIRAFQGQMSSKRQELVSNAFDFLDKEKVGYINFDDLVALYDSKNHPFVIRGKLTTKAAHEDFVNSLKDYHLSEVGESGDLKVTKNEFIDYYTSVSATITMDTDFELIINNCWNIKAETLKSHYERGWTKATSSGRTAEEEKFIRKFVPQTQATLKFGLESKDNPWQTVNNYYQKK